MTARPTPEQLAENVDMALGFFEQIVEIDELNTCDNLRWLARALRDGAVIVHPDDVPDDVPEKWWDPESYMDSGWTRCREFILEGRRP